MRGMAAKYPPWVNPFLDHLKSSCNMAESCRAVGIGYSTMMSLKSKDADFEAACDEALEEAYDYLEAECRRRAFHGVEEPVVYQGQLTPVWERDENGDPIFDEYDAGEVYPKGHAKAGEPMLTRRMRQARDANGNPQWLTVRKYSDALAQFLMKGYRRRKFGDKQEITGANGGPLSTVDETKKAARLAALLSLAQTRKAQALPADDDIADLA